MKYDIFTDLQSLHMNSPVDVILGLSKQQVGNCNTGLSEFKVLPDLTNKTLYERSKLQFLPPK